MAKTETQIDLKINKGTYAKIQENLSQIGEDELIITTDKNIPMPSQENVGKGLIVDNSGNDYVFAELQYKNLINDIEANKASDTSYPSTKAVYDFCQTLGIPIFEYTPSYRYGWPTNTEIYNLSEEQGAFFEANKFKPIMFKIKCVNTDGVNNVTYYILCTYWTINTQEGAGQGKVASVAGSWYDSSNIGMIRSVSYQAYAWHGGYLNRLILESNQTSPQSTKYKVATASELVNRKSNTNYYTSTPAVYDFVKSETKYLVVSDYSALPSSNVTEGTLAYVQSMYLSYEVGFYQYKNSAWSKIELENLAPVNVTITGNFDPTQTFTFTIDGDDLFPLYQGSPLAITFTGGGSSVFRPDFLQISQTEYTSSTVVVLNGTQYIATINFDLSIQSNNATLSFSELQAGSGGGGTGESTTITPELYTFQFNDLMAGPLYLYMTSAQYNQLVQALSQAGYTISSPSDIENLYNNGTLLERLTGLGAINLFKMGGSADGYLLAGYEIDQNTGSITVNYFENDGTVNTSTWTAQNVSESTLSIGYVSQTISGGGSSSGGGSGKLYELSMELTRYDENGDAVEWIGTGIQANQLPITINIYESNFEKIKVIANNLIDFINNADGTNMPHIENINGLVQFINTIVSETLPTVSAYASGVLITLVNLCDKAYITGTNIIPFYYIINADPFNLSYQFGNNVCPLNLTFFDNNNNDYSYGLNVNNSCTLTEYGTSGSGGSSQPTIPERFSLAYNLVVNINQEQFANGSWTGSNSDNIRTFQYNGSNADEAKAKELVEFLTGVNVLDSYNATKPTPCFVFCTQSNICWKLQWDNSLLHAYKVENFPFVVKEKYYEWALNTATSNGIGSNHLTFKTSETLFNNLLVAVNQVMSNQDPTWQDITDKNGLIALFNQLKLGVSDPDVFSLIVTLFGVAGQAMLDEKAQVLLWIQDTSNIDWGNYYTIDRLTSLDITLILKVSGYSPSNNMFGVLTSDSSNQDTLLYIDSNATLSINETTE